MDSFVDHYFSINQTEYDMDMPLQSGMDMPLQPYMPLQSAKYIIDILSPLILFSLSTDDTLLLYDTNQTKLSQPMYEYFMQFNIYPKYKQFIKQKRNFCKRVLESFYPSEGLRYDLESEYETAKPSLQEYYGINEDPRKLISMRQDGNSITYTKERWLEFIHRMTPDCYGQFNSAYYDKLTNG